MPVILALRRLRQENCEFKLSWPTKQDNVKTNEQKCIGVVYRIFQEKDLTYDRYT